MLLIAAALTTFVAVATAGLQLERTPENGIPKCVSASSKSPGSPIVIHDCFNGDASRYDWEVTPIYLGPYTVPGPIKLFSDNFCMDVKDGSNTDGTKLQVWTCIPGNSNQQFISLSYSGVYQWVGTNKCIDLTDGDFTDGNQLQIWTCDTNNQNQQFSGKWVPDTETLAVQLEVYPLTPEPPALCLTASQNTDGAKVSLALCDDPTSSFPSGNSTWVIPRATLSGLIRTYDGSKCLDLPSGDASNGNRLQVWTCDEENPNQIWTVDYGSLKISRIGEKCVDIRDGKIPFEAGTDIQIWDCDVAGNDLNQRWFVSTL